MRKMTFIGLICLASLSLCCCNADSSSVNQSESANQTNESTSLVETSKGTNDSDSDVINTTTVSSSTDSGTETESSESTEPEHIKNYNIYAEKGAVITMMDSKTGHFKWKGKCESCGNVENTEHTNGYILSNGSKLNTGFVCSNPKCSLWGKSQPVVIGCDVTEE